MNRKTQAVGRNGRTGVPVYRCFLFKKKNPVKEEVVPPDFGNSGGKRGQVLVRTIGLENALLQNGKTGGGIPLCTDVSPTI